MKTGGIIGAMGVGFGLVGGALAGLGSDGGFDMFIHFPGFFVAPRAATTNLQAFTGALGGVAPEPVTASGDATRPFSCNGNTFTTFADAATRSCEDQQNACSDVANSGAKNTAGITVAQCQTQLTQCLSQASTPATVASSTSTSTTSTLTTTSTSTTPPAIVVVPPPAATISTSTTTTAPAPAVVVPSSAAAAVPVPVPVQESTPAAALVVPVTAPSATLHSSDENFFYFCDP